MVVARREFLAVIDAGSRFLGLGILAEGEILVCLGTLHILFTVINILGKRGLVAGAHACASDKNIFVFPNILCVLLYT